MVVMSIMAYNLPWLGLEGSEGSRVLWPRLELRTEMGANLALVTTDGAAISSR